MQTTIPALCIAVTMSALSAVSAAQQRPDFSGTWVMAVPAGTAGYELRVAQDATTLKTGHSSVSGQHDAEYRLDGEEAKNTLVSHGQEIVTTYRASWTGPRLTIEGRTVYPDGRNLEQQQTWSLDGEGRLVIEIQESMSGGAPIKQTVVHRKK